MTNKRPTLEALLLEQVRSMKQRVRNVQLSYSADAAVAEQAEHDLESMGNSEAPCGQCGLVGPHLCLPSHRDGTVTDADNRFLRSHDPASEDYAEDFLDSGEDMNF